MSGETEQHGPEHTEQGVLVHTVGRKYEKAFSKGYGCKMMVKAQEKMWPKSCKIDWISFLNRQTTLNSGTTPDPDTIQEWENSQLPTGTCTLSCPVPALPGCLLLAALGSRTLGQGHSKGNL